MIKKIAIILFILGLVYVGLPGPKAVEDFPPLKPSVRSNQDGDTWQNKNIAAYYSDFKRAEITNFYKSFFSRSIFFGVPLPVISLNHPPERAYQYIRDQQESTFLEEYVFPFRESIFVNGYEPKVENDRYPERERSFVGDHIFYGDTYLNSKTTLRYYPSSIFARISVYIGVWMAGYYWLILFRKVLKEA